jgi:hypothetical protein
MNTMLNVWVPQYGSTVFQAELWPILCPAGCIALVNGGPEVEHYVSRLIFKSCARKININLEGNYEELKGS